MNSIVRIESLLNSNTPLYKDPEIRGLGMRGSGSRFYDNSLVLTSYHVIDHLHYSETPLYQFNTIYVTLNPEDPNPTRVVADVIIVSPTHDLALIKLRKRYEGSFLDLEEERHAHFDQKSVITLGFPGGKFIPSSGHIQAIGERIQCSDFGVFSQINSTPEECQNRPPFKVLETTADSGDGNSGAPVISTETEKLIGVIAGSFEGKNAVAIHFDHIKELIKIYEKTLKPIEDFSDQDTFVMDEILKARKAVSEASNTYIINFTSFVLKHGIKSLINKEYNKAYSLFYLASLDGDLLSRAFLIDFYEKGLGRVKKNERKVQSLKKELLTTENYILILKKLDLLSYQFDEESRDFYLEQKTNIISKFELVEPSELGN